MTARFDAGWRLDAPAKLNLYLHVLGRRRDGYHRLDSLAAFLDLGDTVIAAPSDRLVLASRGPWAASLGASLDGDNIVLRAARLLAAEAGIAPRARIGLVKRIPVAAGLGGGSADAAAALRVLDRLWRARAGADDLAALGRRLGADVPVCLAARPTRMRGIGDRLEPAAPLPETAVVLVNPRRALSTKAVFQRADPRFRRAVRPLAGAASASVLATRLARRRNDLTTAAVALEPAIADVLASLAVAGALLARMSGSGATCFGLFADAAAADRAAAWLRTQHEPWWICIASLRRTRPRPVLVAGMQQRQALLLPRGLRLDTRAAPKLG